MNVGRGVRIRPTADHQSRKRGSSEQDIISHSSESLAAKAVIVLRVSPLIFSGINARIKFGTLL